VIKGRIEIFWTWKVIRVRLGIRGGLEGEKLINKITKDVCQRFKYPSNETK